MATKSLRGLVVCRHFLEDPVIQALLAIQEKENEYGKEEAAALLLARAEELGLGGNLLRQYFLYLLGEGDTVAAKSIERSGQAGTGLTKALLWDMNILWPYLEKSAADFLGVDFLDNYEPAVPRAYRYIKVLETALMGAATPEEATKVLLHHYATYGRGKLAQYIAFRLDDQGGLVGIENFPQLHWEDLIGYKAQKERLLANTTAFLAGHAANNVLLTGARGTGKSTAVKTLVCRYQDQGLRLIQVQRGQLHDLQPLMEKLADIGSKKFILFLDDLSFDEDEKEYKFLKSAIDGGVTPQPGNVLIYATSNRRHLLKETWRDRNDELDEVYRQDSTNESISLSDRFGLILHYAAPTQDEYLEIIAHELKKAGITLKPEELRVQGVQWEMEHSGRNGRIAQQFVKWYLGSRKS